MAKKQDDNLRRLIELFQKHPKMAAKRVIIVDDEADSASIGYSKKGDVKEANKIAAQISELRTVIPNVAFLQVTATPYSLYLQPTEVEVSNVMEFKPMRPAFTKLVPVPSDYVGGDTYFGESARSSDDTLESLIHFRVDHHEFDRLKKPDGRAFKLENALAAKQIAGYRTALVTFIVGGCIQRINGINAGKKQKKLRYAFLLHSEAGKEAHDWQERLTKAMVKQLKQAAEEGMPLARELVQSAYDDLVRSLSLDGKPSSRFRSGVRGSRRSASRRPHHDRKSEFGRERRRHARRHGTTQTAKPSKYFLGGQVLDRGVTLANLIGFYYGRRPNKFQQDTVLQHSRMYGYRRDDLAVTRFYTSLPIVRP